MKLLIDTNVFLEFYRSQQDKLATLDDLARLATAVMFPEQVMREFRRNRSERIDAYLATSRSPPAPVTPGFLADVPEAKAAVDAHRSYSAAVSALRKVVEDRKLSPANDPVSAKVEALYVGAEQVPATEEIVAKAEKRMLRGDPPMSTGKRSVGDEIIWESVLSCARDDLILVSRDGTFTKHQAFLSSEFSERTGKTLDVIDKISLAQKKLKRPEEETKRAVDAERDWGVRTVDAQTGALLDTVTPIPPGTTVTIVHGPDTIDRTLVVADPQIQGHLFVRGCKIANIDLLVGGVCDLAVFSVTMRPRVPAGDKVTLYVSSNAPMPMTIVSGLV